MKKIICIALVLVMSLTAIVLVACKDKIADNTEHFDEITKTLTLNKSYEGKNFLTQGIGKATVDAYTDGDTARFRLVPSGDVISVRFYQIDTPESTSNVEKWGKAASAFTKSCLMSATEIVLEATADRAQHDSYGSRYLAYVWYKPAGQSNFKCLNLELVENGYTENKGVNTADYPYYSYFKKANDFAKSIQLRLYSKLDDPSYSTDPLDMTFAEFYANTDLFYNADMEAGAKIKTVAYLKSLYVSPSGTYTFTAAQYNPETGKELTMNVYAGYVSASASSMQLGQLYTIYGTIQNHYGTWQITGLSYDELYTTMPGLTVVKQKNYYVTFNSSLEFISQYNTSLFTDVTVVSTDVTDGKLTITGTATQRRKVTDSYPDGLRGDAKIFTFTVKVPSGYNNEITAGTKFSVSGFQLEANSGKITIPNYSDIKIN